MTIIRKPSAAAPITHGSAPSLPPRAMMSPKRPEAPAASSFLRSASKRGSSAAARLSASIAPSRSPSASRAAARLA